MLQVRQSVEYLSYNLRVRNNVLVTIVLQSARRKEEPFVDLSPREIEFAPKRGWCVCAIIRTRFVKISDARDELLHLGRFFVDSYSIIVSFCED